MNQFIALDTNTQPTGQAPTNPTNTGSNANNQQTSIPPIENPFGGKTIGGSVNQVINILLSLIVIAAVVMIIVAGFRMITGGGNPDQIAKAKRTIVWAIIGLVVAFMSFAIVQIIQSLLQRGS